MMLVSADLMGQKLTFAIASIAPSPSPYTPVIYLSITSLTVHVWDWLISISCEYYTFQKTTSKIVMFIYFFSRVTTLTFLLDGMLFTATPIGSCTASKFIFGWLSVCSLSASAALFYLRVKAVYAGNRLVAIGFGIFWLGVVASWMLFPFVVEDSQIGKRCITQARPLTTVGIIVNTCYSTLIFIAISWKLVVKYFCGHNPGDDWNFRAFISGAGLPSFTKTVLQSGQLYYFVTVSMNIINLVVILLPSVPAPLQVRAVFSNLATALENIMTTRAFRAIALGAFKDDLESTTENFQSLELSTFRATYSSCEEP